MAGDDDLPDSAKTRGVCHRERCWVRSSGLTTRIRSPSPQRRQQQVPRRWRYGRLTRDAGRWRANRCHQSLNEAITLHARNLGVPGFDDA